MSVTEVAVRATEVDYLPRFTWEMRDNGKCGKFRIPVDKSVCPDTMFIDYLEKSGVPIEKPE